jgi:hypothetical protein
MKLPLDSEVISKVKCCVETATLDLLRNIVRVCKVKHAAHLQDSSGACRGDGLGVKTSSRETDKTGQEQDLYLRRVIPCDLCKLF